MRILVLTQVVIYPADAGPKVKTLQVVRHLAAQHDVLYCSFVRGEDETRNAQSLATFCRRIVTVPIQRSRTSDIRYLLESIVTNDSFLLRRDERSAMHEAVKRLLQEEQVDAIHVDQLNMMRFVPANWQGKVILDEHNAVWQVVERLRKGARRGIARLLLGREVRLIRKLEGEACRRATAVLAVSEQDRDALRAVAGDVVAIEVVPITVDVAGFEQARRQRAPQVGKFFTIGTMFWPPNSEGVLWWLREGYSSLHHNRPEVVYDIVGARPPRALQVAAEQCPGVQVHGYVADVKPFWSQATALLVPILSGGGVRVKILEAMARGVPVISTTIGCEGLAVRDGEHLLIADTPEACVAACERLMQDQELARQLADHAYQLVCERYDAASALNTLNRIYASPVPLDI
jgi:glycosyltransferase involved in cell wall biosynthesis